MNRKNNEYFLITSTTINQYANYEPDNNMVTYSSPEVLLPSSSSSSDDSALSSRSLSYIGDLLKHISVHNVISIVQQ